MGGWDCLPHAQRGGGFGEGFDNPFPKPRNKYKVGGEKRERKNLPKNRKTEAKNSKRRGKPRKTKNFANINIILY